MLRSAFPQGFQENAFAGSDETVGEQNCKFLEAWYGLGSISAKRKKSVADGFPKFGRQFC